MSRLNDDTIKSKIIELDSQGYTNRQIADACNIPRSTVGDFLRKDTYQSWWAKQGQTVEEEFEVTSPDSDTVGEAIEVASLCESADWDVANLAKRLRTAQRTNAQLRRTMNAATDVATHIPDMVKAVEKATQKVSLHEPVVQAFPKQGGTEEAIVEILLSDYQIGKVGQYFNSKLAEQAMKKYGEAIQKIIYSTALNYSPQKIVLALLGDLVEDHLKHGVQSATSTDCGLSEQMALAIEHLWKYIIQPLAESGIPMEVVCIAGNHGSSQHKGMDMFKAGLYSYDYTIFKALEGYCKVGGYDQVEFTIPEGCFAYTEIFGRCAVYEHGYFNSCTEKSLEDQRNKRSNQLKRHVEYFRCGDMHHVCNYDNGSLVVNGAFFGVDTEGQEYSGIMGFSSIPAQVTMVHTKERSLGRNTVKETHTIQVADGY